MREEARKWKALGDPARWRIFCVLATRPRSVTELCEELDTYQSQVSGHLAVLRGRNRRSEPELLFQRLPRREAHDRLLVRAFAGDFETFVVGPR